MSYFPRKTMWRDQNGVGRFNDPGTAPEPAAGKRWYEAEVVRKAVNGRGEVMRRNRQRTAVFCREEDAIGLAVRQCPDPGMGEGDIQTNVYVREMAAGSTFPGSPPPTVVLS